MERVNGCVVSEVRSLRPVSPDSIERARGNDEACYCCVFAQRRERKKLKQRQKQGGMGNVGLMQG